MTVTATIYRIWVMTTQHDGQVLYLPVLALWLIYYAICLRRNIPASQVEVQYPSSAT